MIRKYHNHKPQTTLWQRGEEPLNHQETPGIQIKQSIQLSLPHQDDCNTRTNTKQRTTKHRTIADSHNWSNNKQKVNNNRTTTMLHIKIKDDDAGSNIVANILPTDTPLAQGVGSKVQTISFSESSHVAYQFKADNAGSNMVANILPRHTLDQRGEVKRSNYIFFWKYSCCISN